MKKILKTSLLFSLCFCIAGYINAQSLQRVEQVAVQLINGLPYIQVKINGNGPYLFGFDSGMGTDLEIDSSLAAELNLQISGQTQMGDPSGKNPVTLNTSVVKNVSIGKIHFTNVNTILRNRRTMQGMENVSGIIGMALFKDFIFTVDYPALMCYIEKGNLIVNDKDVLAYKPFGGGVPTINIKVGNFPLTALVDTRNGSSEFKIPESLIDKLHFASEPKIIGQGRTISNVITINEVKLQDTIEIGKHKISEPVITYPSFSEEAIIGAKFLKNFIISIDAKNKAIRFVKGATKTETAAVSTADLKQYTGKYGERTVSYDNDNLYIQRGNSIKIKMVFASKDHFGLEGFSQAKIEFTRNEDGKITSLKSLQPDGEWQISQRE